jgi:hypothetical protein
MMTTPRLPPDGDTDNPKPPRGQSVVVPATKPQRMSAELRCIAHIERLLDALNGSAPERILRYLTEKYSPIPPWQVQPGDPSLRRGTAE